MSSLTCKVPKAFCHKAEFKEWRNYKLWKRLWKQDCFLISPWVQVGSIQGCQQLPGSSQSCLLSSCKGHEIGRDPKDWRKANLTLLFEKGKKDKQENYRLASLVPSSCARIVEEAICGIRRNRWRVGRARSTKDKSCLIDWLVLCEKIARSKDGESVGYHLLWA